MDFEARIVRLEPNSTKNDEGRVFPVAALPELEAFLKEQRKLTTALEKATGRIIQWVFHHDGERIRHYKTAWMSACERAHIPRAWVHDLRRTAVRNLVRASGTDPKKLNR